MNREKMSKSTGNVVNPFFAIDRFGVDGMRFFLAYQGGLADDADYDNAFIIRDYKKWLQGGIGNLAHRTIGCAKGKLGSYIQDATSGKLGAVTAADREHQAMLVLAPTKVAEHMTGLNPRAALQEIMSVIEKVRSYDPPRTTIADPIFFTFIRPTNTSMQQSRGKPPIRNGSCLTWLNPCASPPSCSSRSCPASHKSFWNFFA
jgi:leucyl-tRNA synthetase